MRLHVEENSPLDLVSLNIRGAVLALSPYVTAVDAYMSWARHGFFHPEYNDPATIRQNPGFYDSLKIFPPYLRMLNGMTRTRPLEV